MEYYYIQQDDRVSNIIEPIGNKDAINTKYIRDGQLQYINTQPVQLYIKEKSKQVYTDYIKNPVSLISDKLKQIFDKFEIHVFYKPVVLADVRKMRQDLYWIAIPEIIDCYSTESELNKNGSIKKLVINKTNLGYLSIFKIKDLPEDLLIVNSDIAEEILESDCSGITLHMVKTN